MSAHPEEALPTHAAAGKRPASSSELTVAELRSRTFGLGSDTPVVVRRTATSSNEPAIAVSVKDGTLIIEL